MARVAPRVPELSEVLCTSCGYVLDGLDESGRCPECGQPIAQSKGVERIPPAWESALPGQKVSGFISSSNAVILHPARFYRTLNVRGELGPAKAFARIHWSVAATLFALASATHAIWFSYHIASPPQFPGGKWALFTAIFVALTMAIYFALDGITRLAAKLTNLEGTYRGYRLPYAIVLRGLYYHAAHYIPVAISAIIVVCGYQLLMIIKGDSLYFDSPTIYLYVLSGQIVLSAIYLFQTYWIGMRNMMYANR